MSRRTGSSSIVMATVDPSDTRICVTLRHLVSERTFSVMYHHTIFYVCKSQNQISANGLSGWWFRIATLIFFTVVVCVGMYGSTHSSYHPRGYQAREQLPETSNLLLWAENSGTCQLFRGICPTHLHVYMCQRLVPVINISLYFTHVKANAKRDA